MEERGPASADAVRTSLRRRDRMDRTRKMDPLKIAPGADVVDTTRMSIEEVTLLIACKVEGAADGS